MRTIWVSLTMLLLLLGDVSAAELGQSYSSYVEMHNHTRYGSLFFNQGATNQAENRELQNFILVNGDGDLKLPSQNGYCFFFSHFDKMKGYTEVLRYYRATIIKKDSAGRVLRSDDVFGRFLAAAYPESSELPDVCFDGVAGVSTVEVRFVFDRSPSFTRVLSFRPHVSNLTSRASAPPMRTAARPSHRRH